MAKCPKCKEELPLLSKICPVCGYVVDDDEDTPNAEDFANALEKCLFKLRGIPKPSFFRSMGQLSVFMYPLLAVYTLIIALISNAGLFWLLFILFGILFFFVLFKKAKGELGNEPFNREFESVKNEYEYYKRTAERNFGKSREVSKLLDDISAKISTLEASRKNSNRKNILAWLAILIIFFVAGGFTTLSINKTLNSAKKIATNGLPDLITDRQWQEAIHYFNASTEKDDEYECNKLALDIIPIILSAGESAKAEELFLQSCMGKIGDFDCATLIVKYHQEKNNPEGAKAFIQRCNKMRYKSDQKKLEKLLKQST